MVKRWGLTECQDGGWVLYSEYERVLTLHRQIMAETDERYHSLLEELPNADLRKDIEKMAVDYVVSGGPGPLYGAGWAAACEYWGKRLLQHLPTAAVERSEEKK